MKALAAIPATVVEFDGIAEVVLAMSALLAIASLLAVITRRLRIPLPVLLVAVGFAASELARVNGVELPVEGETFHDVLCSRSSPCSSSRRR